MREEASGGGVRSFVAVLLSEAVRARLASAAEGLRARGVRLAWVRAESLHLTLRFLGAVDAATLAGVHEALAEAARATRPFRVTLRGLGGFPPARPTRVVWAGVTEGAAALTAFHARLEAELARRGLPPEGRPFHPHVTLGRARDAGGARELAAALAGSPAGAGEAVAGPFGEALVEAVHLMRSDLAPTGARHAVVARVRLGHSSPVDM